jgi:DNA polymerase-1
MLKYTWIKVHITSNEQANNMIALFKELNPKVGAFDTETTGLHITKDKPFLFQFGFLHPEEKTGYVFSVDIEQQPDLATQVIKVWQNKLAPNLDIYLGHNVKFDLHMMRNLGLPYEHLENISDTMFYIRYGHDALTPASGGPPMGLKDYSSKYIDGSAKFHEKLLATERTSMAKEYNAKLQNRLKALGRPPAEYDANSYNMKVLDTIFKDPTVELEDLPADMQKHYTDWLQLDLPIWLQSKVTSRVEPDMIPYNKLDRTTLTKYAQLDIVYTLEIYNKLAPVVVARGNTEGIKIENKLIPALIAMESCGFEVDKEYLLTAKANVKAYIREQREKLYTEAGTKFAIGQHEFVKNLLNTKYGLNVPSTGSEELDRIYSDLLREDPNNPAVNFIKLLQELRTLEKWYAVYILRFIKNLQDCNRLYTQINQVGAVSGRVTCDFQQFPKEPIVKEDGTELFHPRSIVKITGGDYKGIVYLDFSQIELRIQALYTILVSGGDLNLCRAYMPFHCIDENGNEYDYKNPELHHTYLQTKWFLKEDPSVEWTPTDLHGLTATIATGLKKGDDGFKHARSAIGKRVNFAKNYGASISKIAQMFPDKTWEEIERIDGAYYTAFPEVKTYHSYCYERANYAYTQNLFGIKYYGLSGHKLINTLVQGSAAYYLKLKILALWEYMQEIGCKTRFQFQVHDELSWEWHKDDPLDLFFKFKEIMQEWDETYVPLVAEMDATKTLWSQKKPVSTIEELRQIMDGDTNE